MKDSSLFSYESLVHAFAGSVGSMTAMSIFYPLDTVRSRLQLCDGMEAKSTLKILTQISKNEGLSELYRGLIPVLQSLCASNFVYFYSFHGLKRIFDARSPASAKRDVFLGSIAGIINVLTTTPLWVVNTRLKMNGLALPNNENKREVKYRGLIDGLIKIAKTEGISALWNGTLPSLLLVSNPALQFMTYESIKRKFTKDNTKQLHALVYFFIGALSKLVATVSTYPIQIVQTKLRHGYVDKSNPKKPVSSISIAKDILRKNGPAGFYKGMESKVLQTILTAALMFSMYEKIISFVFGLMRLKRT